MAQELLKISSLNLPSLTTIPLPEAVKGVIKTLNCCDTDIYLVGGFLRDLIIGRKSTDFDFIVVNEDSQKLCNGLAAKHDGNWFVLDKDTGTTRVVLKDELSQAYTFDFTPVLRDSLEADFSRRDFTINTLAVNLKEPDVLIDRFSSFSDIKNKKIKAVNLKNLIDDPLRFIRAFRFACLIEGEIDLTVLSFIQKNLNYFNESVAGERISLELWKILDNANSFKYFKQMADSGLLEKIFPELTPMRKVTPNDYHHLWLFDHSIELIKTFEENYYKIPQWAQDDLDKPFGNLDFPKKKSIAKLGCLFHDVGKPSTWEIKKDNGNEKHTFYGHDKVGAEITKKIGERLKFSNSIVTMLSLLVSSHLRPFQLSQPGVPATDRALYRFFRSINEGIPLLLTLAMADLYATRGPKISSEDLINGEKLLLFLFNEYEKYQTKEIEKSKKPKLLDGNEIMTLTGLKPAPELGVIIKELDEAIAVGEIKTKEEAKKWVLKRCLSLFWFYIAGFGNLYHFF